MGVPEGFEDLNLAIEVFFQLLVETGELDRLDGYQSTSNLRNGELATKKTQEQRVWVARLRSSP